MFQSQLPMDRFSSTVKQFTFIKRSTRMSRVCSSVCASSGQVAAHNLGLRDQTPRHVEYSNRSPPATKEEKRKRRRNLAWPAELVSGLCGARTGTYTWKLLLEFRDSNNQYIYIICILM